MPIYEFYCPDCHCIYQFLSQRIDTARRPPCPACDRKRLDRQITSFAITGKAKDPEGEDALDDLPIDEAKMERAMMSLAAEAEGMDEDDPRAAAALMKKFTDATGMDLGPTMQEAMRRMEAGEDPDAVEQELGDALEEEDPFLMGQKGGLRGAARNLLRGAPRRDETLYEM